MITEEMLISDILAAHPEAVTVFERHGLACGMCLAARMESLSAVATVHDVAIQEIIADLNAVCGPARLPDEGE